MTNTNVVIALVGLAGVIVTAVLGNWDKLFSKTNVVQAAYSGYQPTQNFETELRHYFDVSGTRQSVEWNQRQMLLAQRTKALEENPDDAKQIAETFDAIEKEAIPLDDVIRALLPVYQKYFTLPELQQLNKFYSTDVMQGLVNKVPLLAQDAAPIQVKMLADYYGRLNARLRASSS